MITREFNLNLHAGHSIPLVINASQYDRGEQWVFTLLNSDGTQYSPNAAAIAGTKSDGNLIVNAATVDSDGRVVVSETEQMTAAAGKAKFELLLDDQTHGTANFVVLVEASPADEGVPSASDLSLIQQAIDGTSPTAIAAGVSAWMSEHLTPTTPVVDASLTVQGAAADAKKTGDELNDLKSEIGNLSELETESKTDLVSAINEAAQSGGSGLVISDYDENDIYIEDDGRIVATGITLNQSTLQFSSASSQTLTATLIPSNAQESVIWSSSDDSVAIVEGTGATATVTAVGNGNATITATTDTTALTATCAVVASGLPEVGVRYRLTGSEATTETSQVLGGANVTFRRAPTVESDGVYLTNGNYMMIENANNWFDGSWTIEIVFVPRLTEDRLSLAAGMFLFDGKYGDKADGSSSTSGHAIGIQNPRDNGYIGIFGYSSTIDFRPYNNTECTIKVQHPSSGSGAVFLNGEQLSTTASTYLPANKNVYFNAFNKSASNFAHLLKSFVVREGVV